MALSPTSSGKGAASGGGELDYAQIVAQVAITSVADGAGGGTLIVAGNAVSYGGATRVEIRFWCPLVNFQPAGVANAVRLNVYEGATDLGRIAFFSSDVTTALQGVTLFGSLFLTPAAGAHTYSIRGWKSAAGDAATVFAGAGGSTLYSPAYMRIVTA